MSRYDDFRSSTGTLDSRGSRWDADRFARERHERLHSRGPPVVERPRRFEEDRFESRLYDTDRYGPPARRPGRYYEDDHIIETSGPLMAYDRHERRRPAESPSPRPRLVRRQSSLDTFDRIPSRKLDELYIRDHAPRPALPARRHSPRRYHDSDYYDDIGIAEPDYFGDEEYRGFRERDRYGGRPRSDSRFRERMVEEVVEKPYPRKGKTRIPRKLAHTGAVIELGYPFHEDDDVITLQMALSKDQIDEVISLSREIRRRTETRIIHTSPSPVRGKHRDRHADRIMEHSPRSSHNTLIVEPPSRHRSHSRHNSGLSEKRTTRTVSRTRSISVHGHRRHHSSPGRHEPEKLSSGALAIMVRPRNSDEELRELMHLERRSRGEVVRDTLYDDGHGDREEVLEVKKERKSPNPRLIRAMMATLT
ncbi:hypothetical protein ASPWEDRAFT_44288 [Aspergillus wentii DTO 134E9]|uniref:DUF8035 domain-containing protein n=1 Tax=Aspergillus wentii DTO 134E9 TaxID=1073089 RepID=A0A1L9RBC4_ASPWE|nr:uncharacterized protein ASPWEDRAFT_44288 [Aspergillus wentii DTO 134E9]OJJ32210.1 hypothetical protein ASPWEDRAFT_44288 [Aspergillus wentii DTO 134E9]